MSLTVYVGNAFSLSMLDRKVQSGSIGYTRGSPRVPRPCDDPVKYLEEAEKMGVSVVSVVGHPATAVLFSEILNRDLYANRIGIKLDDNSRLLVGQFVGERLPEGATKLPKGAWIEWWIV